MPKTLNSPATRRKWHRLITVYDDDTFSPANLGRQLFVEAEIGLHKATALINRINRFFGSNWKAVNKRFDRSIFTGGFSDGNANIFISCVDTAVSRFVIAEI
jgi:tRNA A37 threonylcarbamoyladenosine dehydratase